MGILYSCYESLYDVDHDLSTEMYIFPKENILTKSSNASEPKGSAQPTNHETLQLCKPQPVNAQNQLLTRNNSMETLEHRNESSQTPGRREELIQCQQDIIKTLLAAFNYPEVNLDDGKIYVLQTLDINSMEYQNLRQIFYKNEHISCYSIQSITKIYNPYLLIQYKLKQMELSKKGLLFNKSIMFHGTNFSNLDNICKNNFNWRLKGTATGCKFGQGISFSPCAYYATHYGGELNGLKVMIAVSVLVGERCEGNSTTVIPNYGCDTTSNSKGTVVVKYDDNTFYPKYLITYSGYDRRSRKRQY